MREGARAPRRRLRAAQNGLLAGTRHRSLRSLVRSRHAVVRDHDCVGVGVEPVVSPVLLILYVVYCSWLFKQLGFLLDLGFSNNWGSSSILVKIFSMSFLPGPANAIVPVHESVIAPALNFHVLVVAEPRVGRRHCQVRDPGPRLTRARSAVERADALPGRAALLSAR